MSTALLAKLATTDDQGEPVTAPAAGVLHRWIYDAGEPVTAGRAVATVRPAGGGPLVEARAPAGGVLVHRLPVGAGVTAGDAVGHVEPPQRVETSGIGKGTNGHRNGSQSATERRNGRRNGHVAPLVVHELEPAPEPLPAPVPLALAPDERPRVVSRTTRPTDEQASAFDALLATLHELGHDFTRSELERTMYQVLLTAELRDVILAAQQNRKREQAGRYGIAWR